MVVEGIRTRLARLRPSHLRPRISTAYLTYMVVAERQERIRLDDGSTAPDGTGPYRFHEITSADDPVLSFAPRWQRRLCRKGMANGWYCLVAFDRETGAKVGHVWATSESTRGIANGIMNVQLAPDEVYVWDLFIDPAHRQLALSQEMANALVRTFDARGARYGLSHVLYENSASILWHHLFGCAVLQTFNFVHIGERILWKVPLAECPRYGPLSRHGRHSESDPAPCFGAALLPSPDLAITREQLRALRRRGRTTPSR
ncbi:MAG TPA: GNAT family N-acetyltransferase [Microthrixaceae bacterium]|nr:GNAT family N-acetyltransferase [Microthrixaceae bacterium]